MKVGRPSLANSDSRGGGGVSELPDKRGSARRRAGTISSAPREGAARLAAPEARRKANQTPATTAAVITKSITRRSVWRRVRSLPPAAARRRNRNRRVEAAVAVVHEVRRGGQ